MAQVKRLIHEKRNKLRITKIMINLRAYQFLFINDETPSRNSVCRERRGRDSNSRYAKRKPHFECGVITLILRRENVERWSVYP